MSDSVHIKSPRVIDPANKKDAVQDVFIDQGKIVALSQAPGNFKATLTIDATGLIVIPGICDLSVSLCEPGFEHRGTIASETAAAAKGGITTCCCPPDTQPIIDTPSVADLIQQRAQHIGKTRVKPLAAMTAGLKGQKLSEMAALKAAGRVGVANAEHLMADTHVLLQCFNYAKTFDLPCLLDASDAYLAQSGCIHEGILSTRLGLKGIPETAETIGIARALLLQAETGVKLHFCRISCANSIPLIRAAQAEGRPITADVAVYQLFLSEHDLEGFDANYHVSPPLRSIEDTQALCEGVKDGVITAICSHHRPFEWGAKLAPFAQTPPGISGIESLLSLALNLHHQQNIHLDRIIDALTYQPAQIINQQSGTLSIGAIADLCLFDPHAAWSLSPESMLSQGTNTPFIGWPMQGQVVMTLLGGELVYNRSV